MADTDLSALLEMAAQRRDEARREMEGWEDFIRRLGMLGGRDATTLPEAINATRTQTARPKRTEPAVQQTIDATKSFIAGLGRPAGISEIYSELQRLNVPVGGKDPKRTLDARLRYSGVFTGIPGRGWWIAGLPGFNSNAAAPAQSEDAAAEESVVAPHHDPMTVS